MDNRCVCCGEIIPEGRQVCPNCEKGEQMKNNECCASLNYEAEYDRAMLELEKAKAEICHLREELRIKERQVYWYDGVKQTVEVIFGREFNNGC